MNKRQATRELIKQLKNWFDAQASIEWPDLELFLSSFYKTRQEAANLKSGTALELFTKALLQEKTKEFNTKAVYLREEIPFDEKKRLKLGSKDLGNDGLLINGENKRVLWQAKFRSNQKKLTHTELSTFFNVSEFADRRLVIRNTDLSDNAQDAISVKTNVSQLDHEYLNSIDAETMAAIVRRMIGKPKQPKQPVQPRDLWPIQEDAIKQLLALPRTPGLAAPERATCVMPCGTGKTLVSMRYAEAIKAKRIVVLLPSLMLVKQAYGDWCRDSKIADQDFRACVICSDGEMDPVQGDEDDQFYIAKTELPFKTPSTSEPKVSEFLQSADTANPNLHQIVFCTYHSTEILNESLKKLGLSCDLIIFDEAHRTASKKDSFYTYALDNHNIEAQYRLFLTATPKHINIQQRDKQGEYKYLFSMDDETVYGPKVYIDYRQAIAAKRICDYKVIVTVLTSADIERAELIASEDPQQVAHEIAVKKAMDQYGVKKIISFHHRIKDAKVFSQEASKHRHLPSTLNCDFITGDCTGYERSSLLSEFKRQPQALLANARCLTEGVNLPSVDCVAFLAPKRSKIDIIQAIGRAMRKDPKNLDKHYGYVLLPIFVEQQSGEDEHAAIEATNFDTIWDVLSSLKDFDPVLAECFNRIAIKKGRGQTFDPLDSLRDHIDITGVGINLKSLSQHIALRITEQMISTWHLRYGQLEAYKAEHGHCRVPDNYPANPRLGTWVGEQRTTYRKSKLSEERINLLNQLGFDWDPTETSWQAMFAELQAYQAEHGHCRVPQSYSANRQLGTWVGTQRTNYKKGKLSDEQINWLNQLGFDWDPIETAWQAMFAELKAYQAEHGDCNVPRGYSANRQLGTWVGGQRNRKDRLSEEQINWLNQLGFDWDPTESAWQAMFAELKAYQAEYGDCRVPAKYLVNPQLGVWVGAQRNRKDRLSEDKVNMLKQLGFDWDPIETGWQTMFAELQAYQAKHGDCNVPDKYLANPQLARWVKKQRTSYKQGKLSEDRLNLLDQLGFDWDPLETAWQTMFAELKAYQAEHGHCRVPRSYSANPQLAMWVGGQRNRKDRLSEEQINWLNQLGFNWDPKGAAWQTRYVELQAYQAEHGHCRVPQSYSANRQLGTWVGTQRTRYKKGALSEEQINWLNQLGFDWDPIETAWQARFAELQAYQAEHGDCRVPDTKAKELRTLYGWCVVQKNCEAAGTLSSKRKALLIEVGLFDSDTVMA